MKKKRSKPKLITNPDMIIDTGKVEHFTVEEAKADKAARRLKAAKGLEKEMTAEETQARDEAQKRYDDLEKIMLPHAERIDKEKTAMVELAIYSILGDKLGVYKELILGAFAWIIVHKHPETGDINLSKDYKVFVFHGDGNHEIFKGKCSGCGKTMSGIDFVDPNHQSTHFKEVQYIVAKADEKMREPKMLIWQKFADPLVIHSKDDCEKILEVKNNWYLLFEPEEHIYPSAGGGE